MGTNLIELAKQCPELSVTIRLGDLIEANESLIRKVRLELEQLITDANTETYPSREKVAEMLGVEVVTLWRWDKQDYLKPVRIGGKVRYRMSDIQNILGSKNLNNRSYEIKG